MTEEDFAALGRIQQQAYELRQQITHLKKFLQVASECDTVEVHMEAGINEAHCHGFFQASGGDKQAILRLATHRLAELCREFDALPSPSGIAR